MKLNSLTNSLAMLARRLVTMVCCVAAIAYVWQGAFFSNSPALAAPQLLANAGNQIEQAADDVRAGSKDLIRDTKNKVESTANKNAAKVDRADDEGSFVERKAQRDQARIERRAEQDAARTETAVDKSMDAVKNAVESVKDAFGS